MQATYQIAMAAERDAGNRNMLLNNRQSWNEDDWKISCEVFDRIMATVDAEPRK